MAAVSKLKDINLLQNLSPLEDLDQSQLMELAETSELIQFAKGESVSSKVERSLIAYVIKGRVVLSPNSPQSETVEAQTDRARKSILSPEERTRVIADTPATVLCIHSDLLEMLSSWGSGDSGFEVEEIDSSEGGDWLDSLMQSDAVLSLSPSSIQALMSAIKPIEKQAGDVIFNQGDTADAYYIISSGRCVVTRRSASGKTTELAVLSEGDAFGEEALIANVQRNASVKMSESGMLLQLDKSSFKHLMEEPLIKTVTPDEVDGLKAKGAVILDVSSDGVFMNDGSCTNIPFGELREHLDELNKKKRYIVVSDDPNKSSIAAFLLAQKQIVSYVLDIDIPDRRELEEAKEKADAQAQQSQQALSGLKQELEQAEQELAQEKGEREILKAKIRAVEAELRQTQDSARQAILEASSLKRQSEAKLHSRIEELTKELETSKASVEALQSEGESLREKVTNLESEYSQQQASQRTELEALKTEAEKAKEEREQLRETESSEANSLLQQLNEVRETSEKYSAELAALQAEYDQLKEENASLTSRVNSIGQSTEQQNEELISLREEYRRLNDDKGQLDESLAEKITQYEEQKAELARLTQELEELRENNSTLNTQLEEVNSQFQEQKQAHEALDAEHTLFVEEHNKLNEQLADTNRQIEEKQASVNELTNQLGEERNQHQQLQEAHGTLTSEHEKRVEELNSANEHIAALHADVESLENDKNSLTEELTQTTESLRSKESDYESLNAEHESLKSDHENLSDRFDEAQKTIEDRNGEIAELNSEIDGHKENIACLEDKLNDSQNEVTDLSERLTSAHHLADEQEQSIQELKVVRAKLEADVQKHVENETQQAREYQELKEAHHRTSSALANTKQNLEMTTLEFEKRVAELENTVKSDRAQHDAAMKEAGEHIDTAKLRIEILQRELESLQNENKRSGSIVRALAFILSLILAVWFAYYMGVDFEGYWNLIKTKFMSFGGDYVAQVKGWFENL